ARTLVCALVMLAAGRAEAQGQAAFDGGAVGDAGAEASVGRDGGTTDAGDASALDARGDGGSADATPAAAAITAPPPGPPPAPLRGTVLARGGHRRIKGASVFVDGVAVAETDDEGQFSVMAAPGRHRLQAIASRYQ